MQGDIHSAEALEAQYGVPRQQAIPLVQGVVPRIAVRQDLNPNAPEVILCSAVVERGAQALVESKAPVPVYVRQGPNQWVEHGLFRAVELDRNPTAVKQAQEVTGRDRDNHGPLWGILRLEQVDEQ
jgi:hypothetical protein